MYIHPLHRLTDRAPAPFIGRMVRAIVGRSHRQHLTAAADPRPP
jgi:hypothetical protein